MRNIWTRIDAVDDQLPEITWENFTAIAIHPDHPELVLAGSRPFGVHRSEDGGRSWRLANQGLERMLEQSLPDQRMYGINHKSLRFSPTDPSTLYLGLEQFGVSVSENGGLAWAFRNDGLSGFLNFNVISFAVAPGDGQVVFLGSDGGLSRSRDGGRNWELIEGRGLPGEGRGTSGSGTVYDIAFDPMNPQILYVIYYVVHTAQRVNPGGRFQSGVYKSIDQGETWAPANNGMDTNYISQRSSAPTQHRNSGWGIDVDPVNSNRLLAGTWNGIYLSEDGASSWRRVMDGIYRALVVRFDPFQRNIAYAGGLGFLLRSLDGGQTWRHFDVGLEQAPNSEFELLTVNDLAFSPRRVLYAATDSGVFKCDLNVEAGIHEYRGALSRQRASQGRFIEIRRADLARIRVW